MAALCGVASLLLAACQPTASVAAAPQLGESGLATVPLTIVGKRTTHRFTVELARSGEEQQRGLMFRQSLAPDRGMIFPFAEQQVATFWMKNTLIPLDLIFIRADGTIANIGANAVPMDLSLIASDGPVAAVLEIPGGRAAALGIVPGDRVRWLR